MSRRIFAVCSCITSRHIGLMRLFLAGHLPDEFAGAGNDIILLGSMHGEDRDGVEVLARFVQRRHFPPLVYFGTHDDEQAASDLHPNAHFMRDHLSHDSLIRGLTEVLLANERITPTDAFFVGETFGRVSR